MADSNSQANKGRTRTPKSVLLTDDQVEAVEGVAWFHRTPQSDLLRDRTIRWIVKEWERIKPEVDRMRGAA